MSDFEHDDNCATRCAARTLHGAKPACLASNRARMVHARARRRVRHRRRSPPHRFSS
jgi:hypothetical protein